MLRLQILALLSIASLMLSSCSDDEQSSLTALTQPEPTREWTVLFYGAGNDQSDELGNGESRVLTGLRGLEQSRFDERIDVLACVTSVSMGGHVSIYEVCFHPSNESNIASRRIAEWGPLNSGDASTLRQFVEVAMTLYPAERYVLLLNGSGDGVAGACRDAEFDDVMSPAELRRNLETLTVDGREAHFELIAWLAPEMGMIEVAYELKDLARYMAAVGWKRPFDFTDGLRQWMFDFGAAPDAESRVIGEYLVDAVFESAQSSNSDYRYTLWDLSQVDNLATVTHAFSQSLAATIDQQPGRLLSARDSAWVSSTDDSSAIDLVAFTRRLGDDSVLVNSIDAEASEVIHAVEHAIVYSRTTVPSDERPGLSVYLPIADQETDLTDYSQLMFSTAYPGWLNVLTALREIGAGQTTIHGTIFWQSKALDNQFHFFINAAQSGAPQIPFTIPIQFLNFFGPDSASFQVTFTVENDSQSCYIGAYRDVDRSNTFGGGDSLGYFRVGSDLRTWMTIESGATYNDVTIVVNRRQQ